MLHTFKNDLRADCFSQLLEPTIFLAFHVLEGVADPSVLRRVLSTMNKILKKRKLLRKWFEQSGTNYEGKAQFMATFPEHISIDLYSP